MFSYFSSFSHSDAPDKSEEAPVIPIVAPATPKVAFLAPEPSSAQKRRLTRQLRQSYIQHMDAPPMSVKDKRKSYMELLVTKLSKNDFQGEHNRNKVLEEQLQILSQHAFETIDKCGKLEEDNEKLKQELEKTQAMLSQVNKDNSERSVIVSPNVEKVTEPVKDTAEIDQLKREIQQMERELMAKKQIIDEQEDEMQEQQDLLLEQKEKLLLQKQEISQHKQQLQEQARRLKQQQQELEAQSQEIEELQSHRPERSSMQSTNASSVFSSNLFDRMDRDQCVSEVDLEKNPDVSLYTGGIHEELRKKDEFIEELIGQLSAYQLEGRVIV